jgi:hypothetical protein
MGHGKSSLVRWWTSGIGYDHGSAINPQSVDDQRSMVSKWIWAIFL